MNATVSTVECVICHKTHLEVPPPKENVLDKDNQRVFGFDAKDWGYVRDMYEGVYSVVCRLGHEVLLAPKLSKMES